MKTVVGPYKLADAKARLGRLCDQTLKGKAVRILRGGELFELVHVKRPEVVAATDSELRSAYEDPEEIQLLNRFGKESI